MLYKVVQTFKSVDETGHPVATCCVLLRSFGRSLQMLGQQCWDMLRRDVTIVWPGLKKDEFKENNLVLL